MAVLHKDEDIEIRKIVTGSFENNAYLVVCPKTNESVIIDAPAEPERVLDQAKDTNVQAVLFTHTHFDHIDGAQALKDALGVPLVVHPDDEGELPVKADQALGRRGQLLLREYHLQDHPQPRSHPRRHLPYLGQAPFQRRHPLPRWPRLHHQPRELPAASQ